MIHSTGSGQVPEKIFIVGAKGSGKSEFARLLAAAIAAAQQREPSWTPRIAECGEILARSLAARLAHLPGEARPTDEILRWIRAHKEDYRDALRHEGDQLAVHAPAALLTEAASNASIIVGARRRTEVNGFYGADAKFIPQEGVPWAAHVWIFVERPGVGLGDELFERGFFEVQVCRESVVNGAGLENLRQEAHRLVRQWTA